MSDGATAETARRPGGDEPSWTEPCTPEIGTADSEVQVAIDAATRASETRNITRSDLMATKLARADTRAADRAQGRWTNGDSLVVDQGTCALEGVTLDFHLFELCHSGQVDLRYHSGLERGHKAAVPIRTGALQYQQPNAEVTFDQVGDHTIQQVLIDDSVFRRAADGLFKGDADRFDTLGFHGVYDPSLKAMALALHAEADSEFGGEFAADLAMLQIACKILKRQHARARPKPTGTFALSKAELARVVDHVDAHLDSPGDLAALAALIGRDVFHFSRAFRATTGTTPHRWLLERRIERAKEMLAGDTTLAEIAYAVGFSSQAHMTTTFRKTTGTTPGAFRKTLGG